MPPPVKVAKQGLSLRWQSRGRRFEPDLLHIENQPLTLFVGGFLFTDYN